jgi:hypothetical protein
MVARWSYGVGSAVIITKLEDLCNRLGIEENEKNEQNEDKGPTIDDVFDIFDVLFDDPLDGRT